MSTMHPDALPQEHLHELYRDHNGWLSKSASISNNAPISAAGNSASPAGLAGASPVAGPPRL